MKTTFKILLVAIMFVMPILIYGQDTTSIKKTEIPEGYTKIKVRPIRIGAKLGFPNVAGGNIEYVTPILKHKLAANADYSSINASFLSEGENDNGLSLKFSYIEGGLNYYLFKPGRGLYTGLNYGNLKFEGTEPNISSDSDENKMGRGYYDFTHSGVNLKLGAKLGGLFYFRPEVGYSLSKFPDSVDRKVVFDDGSSEIQKIAFDGEDSPIAASALLSGFIFNIGLGFSF